MVNINYQDAIHTGVAAVVVFVISHDDLQRTWMKREGREEMRNQS